MNHKEPVPVDVVHMLPLLDRKLMQLLQSLTPHEWQQPTVARLWTVKDVAAHLLDTNIRVLSILRDEYTGEKPEIHSYHDLVDFLNTLNADWVRAMKRVSPQMLVMLHKITGPLYCQYYASLDPFGKAGFSVAWAGEEESKNWMHIAREYTEKFLHQQQIREAVNRPGLMTRKYYYPFMNIFMLALPYTYRNISAAEGTIVKITVSGNAGGTWFLLREKGTWQLSPSSPSITAELIINQNDAWKLFSKSIRAGDIADRIRSKGDRSLAEVALSMVSVMA